MGTWQDGYVTDIPYTAGFYRELSPAYLHLLAALLGVRPSTLPDHEFAYCELGCGWGLGPLLLAATSPLGRFHGYDFNRAQIAKATQLAARAGLGNVRFGEESFASLAAAGRDDRTHFDLIVLHGVYSWVSEDNRRHLVHYLREHLKPGGMAYVSYNCMPGWSPFTPVQRLLRELVLRRRGRSDENATKAVGFVSQLAARGAQYFKANESVARYLEHLGEQDATYLAHEYLNEHWSALYHLDVARAMGEAGLAYVGSATISDNIIAFAGPPEIVAMFAGADAGMAETIKDFSTNRRFRRDLFVREPERLSAEQFVQALGAIRFALTVEPERVTTTILTSAGEVTTNEVITGPVLERLKAGSASFAELAALPALAELSPAQLAQALSVLVESTQVHPMQEGGAARAASQSLNDVLLDEARHDDSIRFLAAPLLGSGFFVAHPEQLLLLALRDFDAAQADAIRDFVWARFKEKDQRLMKDGQRIEAEADNLVELERRVRNFLEHRLPLLRRLGVVVH